MQLCKVLIFLFIILFILYKTEGGKSSESNEKKNKNKITVEIQQKTTNNDKNKIKKNLKLAVKEAISPRGVVNNFELGKMSEQVNLIEIERKKFNKGKKSGVRIEEVHSENDDDMDLDN
ncbi:hypothetical protein Mgra_00007089 [Meloidogyne graminicola]|uniref:Uncharacterized protein n=1 Tax=Meloidogyne graminicola TaxID=189291 RepID=A0A8S9ZJN1_9BILA|nr:hypothetical protein Mgra_00007089 [Meloidogyne graminicola]